MRYRALATSRLLLEVLEVEDVTQAYVDWLNNPLINRYLEVRFVQSDIKSARAFVQSINESTHSVLFGIKLAGTRRHIGNIKIGPIDPHHLRADVGLLIGDSTVWGNGYATEAIGAVTHMAHDGLGLEKITAGAYASNVGSIRAFLKQGWVEEARLKHHWIIGDDWEDNVMLAHFRKSDSSSK